ncbi:ribosomal RNA small subunit methyltransferase A [Candidatus Wolfebacteria bacterium]|nr:ribosomal RNA small subunit methyltransferase A [Candidatus Wolfebacteria bacterium]
MNKLLGQHFLINKEVPEKIIKALELNKGDVVIEIGPGTGALTFPLIKKCQELDCKLIAIEKDKGLIKNFENKNGLEIFFGDALKDLEKIIPKNKNYKLVGNIPYYITGKLLRTISELKNKPTNTVLMIQREVAARITSRPPNMNLLAAATQLWAEPKSLFNLPPTDFDPPPQVSSTVIRLKSIDNKMNEKEVANFYKSLHVIFKQPRKTLFNNLREGMEIPQEDIKIGLNKLKIDLQLRSQNLSLDEIKSLTNLFTF